MLQAITWDEQYTIGKSVSRNFFYAFVCTDVGEIIAHGADPQNVGKNIGLDFGEYGAGAWEAIQKAGAQNSGFGGVASYMWPTTSCQKSYDIDGECDPIAKVSNVFAWHALRHKLFVGVEYNHIRPAMAPFDQGASKDTRDNKCPDGYASPCAASVCDRLTAHVVSALSIYEPEQVFADINAMSPEYMEGQFYVFVLDSSTSSFLAHGQLGNMVRSLTLIDAVAMIGLTNEQINGTDLFNQMRAIAGGGGGYARYNWTHPLHGVKPKLSFLRQIQVSVNNTPKEVVVGVGFSVAPLPIEHNQGAGCNLVRISACSRRIVLGAVGYAQASLIDALSVIHHTGDVAVYKEWLEVLANGTAITKLIPRIDGDESSEFDNIRLSLIHFTGVLMSSSELAHDGNGTWGVRYPHGLLQNLLSDESRTIVGEDLLQAWTSMSLSGGGFVRDELIRRYSDPTLTDRTPRYALVSSEICHVELFIGGSNCAMIVAEQLDLGCGEGSILVDDSCVECPAGTHHASPGDAVCTPCPAGSFTAFPGRTECTLCAELPDAQFRYQNSTNATSCDLCPKNTVRFLTDPATSLDECHCVVGFFQRERAPFGRECEPCPEGGTCLGAEERTNRDPYPLPGYFGLKDHPHMFVECDLGEKNCIGGESFLCGEGYYGNVCSECENGYFRVYDTGYPRQPAGEGACRKCAPGAEQWGITIVVTFLVFALWFGLNEVPFEALTIMLEFMQISDVLGQFDLDFPPTVKSFWQVLSHSVNFDVDIVVYWQCHVPTWRFQAALVLLFSIAWGKTLLVALVYYARVFAFYLVKNRHLERFPPFLETDQRYVDDGPDRLFESLLQMHWVMYLGITTRVYDVFVHNKRPDGIAYIDGAKWVLVDSAAYKRLLPIAVWGTLVYAIGLPVFVTWVLIRGKQKNLLLTRRYLTRYGFLYRNYVPEHYYWELVILARRITICLTLQFARHDSMLQAAIGLVLCGIFMSATSYALPYRASYIDRFDFFLNVVSMIYIVDGLVETYSDSAVVKSAFEVLVMGLFAISILWLLVLLFIEYDEYKARLSAVATSSARFGKVLTEECIPDEGESVEEARQRVRRVMLASRLAFRLLDRNCSGQVSVEDFEEQFPKLYVDQADRHTITREQARGLVQIMHSSREQDDVNTIVETDFLVYLGRELMSRNVTRLGQGKGLPSEMRRLGLDKLGITEMFMTDAVNALGKYVESHPNSKEVFAETLHDFETSQFSIEQNVKMLGDSVFSEILETLDPYGMMMLVENLTKDEAMEVIRLEKLLDATLHDSGRTSDYSHSVRAQTLRCFMRAAPCLLEYLSNPALCSKTSRDEIARMLDFAVDVYKECGSLNNSFSSMVNVLDQASICDWLMTADERDRSSLYWLINGVRASRYVEASSQGSRYTRKPSQKASWAMAAGDMVRGKETPMKRFVMGRWQSAKDRVKSLMLPSLSEDRSSLPERLSKKFVKGLSRNSSNAKTGTSWGRAEVHPSPIVPAAPCADNALPALFTGDGADATV